MKPSDLGRLLAYTLLGCVAFAGCWALLGFLIELTLGDRFSLSPDPWSWLIMALGMGTMCWTSLVLSALLILSRGPVEGRIRRGSLFALAGWLSLIPLTLIAGMLWAMDRFRGVDLPEGWIMGALFALPVLWSLTWSLDVTRRRRKAVDSLPRDGDAPPP